MSGMNQLRRLPAGFVGMIVLVALVERIINANASSLFDADEWAYRWTTREAGRSARSAAVLCFGDSLIKLGVVPQVIAERTGKETFNLAVSGSQAPASYFLLRRALEAGARPAAIIVGFTPPLVRVGPRHNLTRWPVLLRPWEAATLATWAGDPDLMAEVTLGRVLPSLRGKVTIRAKVVEALGGPAAPYLISNLYNIRNWEQNAGAQLMNGSAGSRGLSDADVANLRAGYYPEWQTHPANVAGIDHFLALAERAGVPIFWVLTPLLPALHDHLARSGIAAQHERFVRSWQAKYPHLIVVDARKRLVDPDSFWDPQHLSVAGAAALSGHLGDTIRDRLARPTPDPAADRWVTLPEFHLGPDAPRVENIEQSKLAVEGDPRLRR